MAFLTFGSSIIRDRCSMTRGMREGSTPSAGKPLRKCKQVWIGDGIGIPHHPGTFEHLALYEIVAVSDRLRHLLLHRKDGRWVVNPAVSTHPVCMSDVKCGAKIA